MTTLLLSGARRCDVSCYGAAGEECRCVCRGRNHGLGFETAATRTKEARERRGVRKMLRLIQTPLFDSDWTPPTRRPKETTMKEPDETPDTATKDLFDEEAAPQKTGAALRDEGITKALAHDIEWKDRAFACIRARDHGSILTSEKVLALVPDPPTPKAVGALIMAASRAGLIEWTGQVAASTKPSSHAALLKVWRRK